MFVDSLEITKSYRLLIKSLCQLYFEWKRLSSASSIAITKKYEIVRSYIREYINWLIGLLQQVITWYRMKEEKTIFKPLAGIEPHIFDLLVRRVNHYTTILSCQFISSMRTQIYGFQLIHRENNALGSLQLPHTLH